MSNQIRELVELLSIEKIEVVDVGGDILASRPEHTAHGALADALVLAGVAAVDADATVMLAGA